MSQETLKMNLNLLPNQAKFQASRIRVKGMVKKITTTAVVIWLSVVVVVLAAWFGSRGWLTIEKNRNQKETAAFLSMSEVTTTSRLLKYRAKFLGKILADRFEYYEAFSRVGKLFAGEVNIRDFVLRDESIFMMVLTVNRGELLDEVEKKVEEINSGKEEGIKLAKISGVSYSRPDRSWTVNLEVELK